MGLVLLALTLVLAACGDDGGGDGATDGGGTPDVTGDAGDDGGLPDHTPPSDLAALVDFEGLFDRDTLEVVIEPARSGRVPGDFDEPIWQIGLTFRSQTFLGVDWVHSATLVLPDDLALSDGSVAILQRSTMNPIDEVSSSAAYLPQFAAITADRLDMPVLLVGDVPPIVDLRGDAALTQAHGSEIPQCFAGPLSGERLVTECLWEVSQASGRADLFPPLPAAVVYVRAVTAMQELADLVPTLDLSFEPPPFRASRAALLGSGLSGLAVRYAMALDGRVAGVMTAGADLGDFGAFFEAQQARWTGGFSLGEPGAELAFFESAAGREFAEAFDLSLITSSLRGRAYLTAIGTNDPFSPLGLYEDYAPSLPSDRQGLYIAGHTEGHGSVDHLLAWRVLLAHLFRGREWAEVDSSFVEEGGNITVTATIDGSTIIQTVDLWIVQRHGQVDDTDLRDAVWQRIPMTDLGDGSYDAAFPNTNANTAFFVKLFDSAGIFEGPVTGPLHRVP